MILGDGQVIELIGTAYDIGPAFGLLVEVCRGHRRARQSDRPP